MTAIQFTAKLREGRLLELPEEVQAQLGLLPGDEVRVSVQTPAADAEQAERERIARIDAAMGSMRHSGVTVEDLHRARREDDAITERQLRGSAL